MVQKGLLYTKEHEWIKVDGDTGTIGVSEHAQEMMGDVTFIELPETAAAVNAKDQLAVIESSKAASDVFAPVSGEIIEINETLEDSPELINESCYDQGWICKIKITNTKDLDNLMDDQAYEKFLAEQE